MKKYILIFLLLALVSLPLSRTSAKTSDTVVDSDSKVETSTSDPVSGIETFLTEKTPKFISKPLIAVFTATEDFRINVGILASDRKAQAELEIKNWNSKDEGVDPKPETSKTAKPLKYVELFFLTLSSFILNNKIIFYIFSVIIVFLALRLLVRLIF